jgi:arylformamidase
MPKILDISRAISEDAPVYPGDEPLRMEPVCAIGPDSPSSITRLHWTTHFLTHLDPPSHFFKEGLALDQFPLERFINEALVIEIPGGRVEPADLPSADAMRGRSLLFKTLRAEPEPAAEPQAQPFDEHHPSLTPDAARRIAEAGANLVGIDTPSVDRHGDGAFPVHRTLLGAGVMILEGLDLAAAAPGRYQLIALPLKIVRGDGSPVRAVLLEG